MRKTEPKIKIWNRKWGVCLGPVIYLNEGYTTNDRKHELGHYAQYRQYWLLYYIIVGIPSVTRWLIDVCFHRHWSQGRRSQWYYSAWPENDADRRGGVER